MYDRPLYVVSPHLDDAVLSLGSALSALPGSTVATVLAGMPPDAARITTDWDVGACGFPNADVAMRTRWEEDRQALALLDATPQHWGFLDQQYGSVDWADVRHRVVTEAQARRDSHTIVGFVGIGHPDHVSVADAFIDAVVELQLPDALIVEDIPYSFEDASAVTARLASVTACGLSLERATVAPFRLKTKISARAAYRSQMRALARRPLNLPEKFWSVGLADAPIPTP